MQLLRILSCLGWEGRGPCLYSISARPMVIQRIVEAQVHDEFLENVIAQLVKGEVDENWSIHVDGSVRFKGRLGVPRNVELRNELLAEAHRAKYTIHPGNTKMYQDLKRQFWWSGMKRDIAQFVANYQICQQVLNTRGLQGCCNLYLYLSGSGIISLWTL